MSDVATKKQVEDLLEIQRQIAIFTYSHIRSAIKHDDDLSMASVPILKVLYKSGPCSQHAIAEKVCHSDAAISRQVSLLEKKGHIRIRHDPNNRRLSLIELTDAGRQAVDRIKREVEASLAKVLSELSEAEMTILIASNQKLCDLLRRTTIKEKHE